MRLANLLEWAQPETGFPIQEGIKKFQSRAKSSLAIPVPAILRTGEAVNDFH
jgi:hypothetical protein